MLQIKTDELIQIQEQARANAEKIMLESPSIGRRGKDIYYTFIDQKYYESKNIYKILELLEQNKIAP
ncbi:hypothetical protein [Synechococcus phage BUCT-ZZ01]|nr:hypothetical protein [Synechococcus phage BUCT-ZZ01]